MVMPRKRGLRDEPQSEAKENDFVSEYELSREERIKENQERMQKLGIFDLSQKLVALKSAPTRVSRRKFDVSSSPLPSSGPVRRSSRIQKSTPVSYCELRARGDELKKKSGFRERDLLREVGSRPEIYTEEDEKLLGSTERSWTLFVDGYGKDGKRIYDPIKGKTCHQCRQKTLGHRTHCIQCQMVQGQFCGDCLYMRYGENVLEANENPDWICPCCRGICNCSLCRQAKGWPPTGPLYRKISSLGYKSVAHYLVQTRRHVSVPDENASTKTPVSAKRSLPFSDSDAVAMASTAETPVNETAGADKGEVTDAEKPVLFLVEAATTETVKSTGSGTAELNTHETTDASDDIQIVEVGSFSCSKAMKKRIRVEPLADSIAGRLRQRRAVQ